MGISASGLRGTQLEKLGQRFGEGVSNAFTSAAGSIGEQVSAASENLGDFTKAVFGDPNEAFTPASIASETVKTIGKDISDPLGIIDRAGEAISSIGADLVKGIEEGDSMLPAGVISKLQGVVPDLADTAALGLSSKLLNSAMGVAGGTAGQAVSKVSAPVISAAQVTAGEVGKAAEKLKSPVRAKQTAAEISKNQRKGVVLG